MNQQDEQNPIGLPPASLRDVFPFHLAFDKQMRVVQLGRGLRKICPKVELGELLTDHFTLITPAVEFSFEGISGQLFTVFFVQYQHDNVVLKGQMLYQEQDYADQILFLCSPVVRDLSSLSDLGVTLNDFAIHDSIMDFLVLLQTKSNIINDVKKMAERLKKEVGVRREAEKELSQINEELEVRVEDRTKELTQANVDLAQEILERRRMADELAVANGELKVWVDKLELYNHEISLLNVMGDMLQACRSIQETYDVIVDILQQLFPDEGGMFALYDETNEEFEVVACWGGIDCVGQTFVHDDCWGLRRAKIHAHESDRNDAVCNHLSASPPHGYLCVPLLVQGKSMGLIHLQRAEAPEEDAKRRLTRSESRRQLIHTASDHVGLAIANLKLQESLHM